MLPRPWVFLGHKTAIVAAALLLAVAVGPASAKSVNPTRPDAVSSATPLPAHGAPGACGTPAEYQNWEWESTLAVDPVDSDHLVTAWTQDWNDAIVVASSQDGGAAWSTAVPRTTACTFPNDDRPEEFGLYNNSALNPWLAFSGPSSNHENGITYLASAISSTDKEHAAIVVNRSTDGGLTWCDPAAGARPCDPKVLDRAGGAVGVEFPQVIADPWRPDYAYALWSRKALSTAATNVYVAHTTDGGLSWSVPAQVPVTPGRFADYGRLIVLPNRDGAPQLLAVVGELPAQPLCCRLGFPPLTGPTTLVLSRSNDFGTTWSVPEDITEADPIRVLASAAVDPDGTVFVAWQRTAADETSRSLMYAKSTDGGGTWSTPAAAGPAIPGPPDLLHRDHVAAPNLAVAPDGTVAATFHDRRNDSVGSTSSTVTDVWLRHTHDGGVTWFEDHLAGPFDQGTAPTRDSTRPRSGSIGWYQGIVATTGGFATSYALASPLPGANFELASGPTDIFFSSMRTR